MTLTAGTLIIVGRSHFRIISQDAELLKRVRADFAAHVPSEEANPSPVIYEIHIHRSKPDWGRIPAQAKLLWSRKGVKVYNGGRTRFVYYRQAHEVLAVDEWDSRSCHIYSEDLHACHDWTYRLILSKAGEVAEQEGWSRIHAASFEMGGKHLLVMMPMGGGKTTLAYHLLKSGHAKLYSDDCSMVSSTGRLRPFNHRMGFLNRSEAQGMESDLIYLKRRDYSSKWLLDVTCFASRLATETSLLDLILLGVRDGSNNRELPRIRPAGPLSKIRYLFRDLVWAKGVGQSKEFYVKGTWSDGYEKLLVLRQRLRLAFYLWRHKPFYTFHLSSDTYANILALKDWIETLGTKSADAFVETWGFAVQTGGVDSLLAEAANRIRGRSPFTIQYANAHVLNLTYGKKSLQTLWRNADWVYADGFGAALTAQWLTHRPAQRFTLSQELSRLGAWASRHGFSIFLLGNEKGLAQRAAQRWKELTPGLVVAGYADRALGKDVSDEAIVEKINASGADIVLVGLGCPLQEQWMAEHRQRIKAPVLWACGAALHYAAGTRRKAPDWLSQRGLEWFWRLCEEPARLWRRYLVGLPLLALRVLTVFMKS